MLLGFPRSPSSWSSNQADGSKMVNQTLQFGRYLRWANEKLIGMLESIPEPDWARDLGGSFTTLLGTTSHHFWALDVWLDRLDGQELSSRFPVDNSEGAIEVYRSVDRRFSEWVDSLNEEDLSVERQVPSPAGKVFPLLTEDILLHLVNHSSYHRGQVVDQIRRLGHAVSSTDYIYYLLQQ